MKKFRTLLFMTLLVFGTSIYAQSKDSLNTKHNMLGSLNFKIKNYALDFKDIDFTKKNLFFSSYNETTKLNDSYLISNKEFIYSKSNLLFENNFRGQKIDSYNPYGVSNLETGLILGVIGELLNEIQN